MSFLRQSPLLFFSLLFVAGLFLLPFVNAGLSTYIEKCRFVNDSTGLRGDVDEAGLTDADRKNRVNVQDLVKEKKAGGRA